MVSNSTGFCTFLKVEVKASSLLKGSLGKIILILSGYFIYLAQELIYSIMPELFILNGLPFGLATGIVIAYRVNKKWYKFLNQLRKQFTNEALYKYYNLTQNACHTNWLLLSLNYTKRHTLRFNRKDIRFSILNITGYATQWH